MRDVWKAALEWYIYYRNRPRKTKLAAVIMEIKDQLAGITSVGDLSRYYMGNHALHHAAAARLFPQEWWLDTQQAEDAAYALRCIELATGRCIDLRQGSPSRWFVETVA